MLLTTKSNKLDTPPGFKLELQEHQKAMLYKCLSIEATGSNVGFMTDAPGTGKTAVVIAMILATKSISGITQNLIIVPQSLFTQWVDEIEKFTDRLKVKTFEDYSDIMDIYSDPELILEYDILITTTLYYETILSASKQVKSIINRVIYDEIDSMTDIITNIEDKKDMILKTKDASTRTLYDTIPENNLDIKISWFISASMMERVVDENDGFKFGSKTFSNEIMCKNSVKCCDTFKNVIQDPEFVNIYCNSDINMYCDYLSVETLDYLNSMNFQEIKSKHNSKVATSEKDIIDILSYDYTEIVKHYNDISNKKTKYKFPMEILKKEKDFSENILCLIHSVKCNKECKDLYKCIKNTLSSNTFENKNSKTKNIKVILDSLTPETKMLIFSDYSGSFKIVSEFLDAKKIKYSDLSGGNIKDITNSVENFKKKDISVLLVNSKSQACGLNLENSDCLVFLHKTSETLQTQVIGRAQRYGRKSKLKIITLLNENELV